MRKPTSIQLFVLGVVLIGSAAACAGSASESPSGGAQVVGPVILDANQTSAELTVGRTVVFNVATPGAWALAADPEGLVELTPGGKKAGAIFNPGATALAAGDVIITLTNGETGETLGFSISIK